MDTRALLDSLDLGVVAIAPDWTIVEWSAAVARLTGQAAAGALRRVCWDALPGAKGTEAERTMRHVLSDGQPRISRLPVGTPGFQGRRDAVEAHITRGPEGHLVLVLQEIPSASRALEEAVLPASFGGELALSPKLFHSLPVPTLLLRPDGVIVEVNAEGARLLGADAASVRTRSLSDWVPPVERARIAAGLRDAVLQRQELLLAVEVPGEAAREVKAVVVNVAATGEPPTLLFLAVDVSADLLLQRRLLQADRLAQVGALVSGVGHELNAPLAAIAAFAEVLGADAQHPDLKESADIIQAEALRAVRIVRTLLDFADQRPRVSVPVDLAEVVEQVLTLQRAPLKRAGVRATVAMPDGLPPVRGDPQELQQVLLNSVVNARQAIEETEHGGQVIVMAQRTDDHVVVTVEDTGPGVPPGALDRVFEPFFTTKRAGANGLGLAISFGLVRAMGGRMWMQNVEGGGARLSFELPLDRTISSSAGVPVIRAKRRMRLLVVEDDDNVRRGMVLLARRLGHEVRSVERFADALERLAGPDAEHYDALLVDVHLDEAHTGFDLFEHLRIKGRGWERRIVFTTGDSISPRTRDALQRSERPVLRKPFGLQELCEVLDRMAER